MISISIIILSVMAIDGALRLLVDLRHANDVHAWTESALLSERINGLY